VNHVEGRFREAIFDTSVRLSHECFMAAHNTLAAIFNLVAALFYMTLQAATATDRTTRTIYMCAERAL
jgi:hypothetical protein